MKIKMNVKDVAYMVIGTAMVTVAGTKLAISNLSQRVEIEKLKKECKEKDAKMAEMELKYAMKHAQDAEFKEI